MAGWKTGTVLWTMFFDVLKQNNLGRVLKDLGDLQGAKKHFERALKIDETALGPDHPQTTIIRQNLERLE
jgi:tetratricopeptide (TPR) repeat protein